MCTEACSCHPNDAQQCQFLWITREAAAGTADSATNNTTTMFRELKLGCAHQETVRASVRSLCSFCPYLCSRQRQNRAVPPGILGGQRSSSDGCISSALCQHQEIKHGQIWAVMVTYHQLLYLWVFLSEIHRRLTRVWLPLCRWRWSLLLHCSGVRFFKPRVHFFFFPSFLPSSSDRALQTHRAAQQTRDDRFPLG